MKKQLSSQLSEGRAWISLLGGGSARLQGEIPEVEVYRRVAEFRAESRYRLGGTRMA